jgi:hypothetical protein
MEERKESAMDPDLAIRSNRLSGAWTGRRMAFAPLAVLVDQVIDNVGAGHFSGGFRIALEGRRKGFAVLGLRRLEQELPADRIGIRIEGNSVSDLSGPELQTDGSGEIAFFPPDGRPITGDLLQ